MQVSIGSDFALSDIPILITDTLLQQLVKKFATIKNNNIFFEKLCLFGHFLVSLKRKKKIDMQITKLEKIVRPCYLAKRQNHVAGKNPMVQLTYKLNGMGVNFPKICTHI